MMDEQIKLVRDALYAKRDYLTDERDLKLCDDAITALLAAQPQGATAVFLTADEIAFVMNELRPSHDGRDFEAECPSCTAFKKLAAAALTLQPAHRTAPTDAVLGLDESGYY